MKQKAALWILGFSLLVVIALGITAFMTVRVDPFFHYHQPKTEEYYYTLDNERSQNNGIIRNFDYQGIITGTSMTQNFKASEAEELWGYTFIKVPFSGGTFREINDNLETALKANPEIRIIIRGLDLSKLDDDRDTMRSDLGEFPTYLYDNDIFNDVRYVFNRDVIFSRVYPMVRDKETQKGITSFDEYGNWMKRYTGKFGKNSLYPKGVRMKKAGEQADFPEEARIRTVENIRQNVVELAEAYPDVTFYCFITPYSAKWWQELVVKGTIVNQVRIEEAAIEEILRCENIKLFSFNNLTDITTNLNNYKDSTHYGEWINSRLLEYMHADRCLLTKENYKEYLDRELAFYSLYDYTEMNGQEDYENDYDAALQPGGE